jgi:hypothetical protein
VDFNQLEHVLDDAPHVGAWQVELRKVNNDPLDLDEIILHVQKVNGSEEGQLTRELSERCFAHLEMHPTRILFHNAEEIRRLQGVGTVLKEQKLVDNRPGARSASSNNGNGSVNNGNGNGHENARASAIERKEGTTA